MPERRQAKRRQLTRREKEFLKHRITGKSLKDSAIAAGYSPNYAQQAGSQAMERIREKAPELFTRVGSDDESYILKHLVPLLEANEVTVFCYNGKPIYSRPPPRAQRASPRGRANSGSKGSTGQKAGETAVGNQSVDRERGASAGKQAHAGTDARSPQHAGPAQS